MSPLRAGEAAPSEAKIQVVGAITPLLLAAAKALGKITTSGNVEPARTLAAAPEKPTELAPMLAIEVLNEHTDPAVIDLLTHWPTIRGHPCNRVHSAAAGRKFKVRVLLQPHCTAPERAATASNRGVS